MIMHKESWKAWFKFSRFLQPAFESRKLITGFSDRMDPANAHKDMQTDILKMNKVGQGYKYTHEVVKGSLDKFYKY